MSTHLTIRLPEEIGRRAQARAAIEGIDLSDLIESWLEKYAAHLEEAQRLEELEEAEDVRLAKEVETAIARGEMGTTSWAEFEAELAALDDLPD